MRRSWYFVGVGTKARDAKEIRVFGLARFVAARFRREHECSLRRGPRRLPVLHRRAAVCFLVVLAGYALTLAVIARDGPRPRDRPAHAGHPDPDGGRDHPRPAPSASATSPWPGRWPACPTRTGWSAN